MFSNSETQNIESVLNDNELKQLHLENEIKFQQNSQENQNDEIVNQKHKLIESNNQQTFFKYEYHIIPQQFLKNQIQCKAIIINNDVSLIIFGYTNHIKIYKFQGEQLIKIQKLYDSQHKVLSLCFMNKSNHFISGSDDHKIRIWEQKNEKEWINIQILEGHHDKIYYLKVNQTDDQFISGSDDEQVIFWKLIKNKWCYYEKLEQKCIIRNVNNTITKLLCYGTDPEEIYQILLIYNKIQEKWIVTQQIVPDKPGFHFSLIDEFQFVFQSLGENILHFYQYDQISNEFKRVNELQVNKSDEKDLYFPIIYIQSKNILIIKNSEFLNIFRKQVNGQFILDQQIIYETECFIGCVSNDGQYLITWERELEEYEVRKLHFIQQ